MSRVVCVAKAPIVLVLALAVSGCGGEGSSNSPSGPGTGGGPTPTPTPTPTFSYQQFDTLTTDADFDTACFGVDQFDDRSFADLGTQTINDPSLASFDASTDSWTFATLNGNSQTFGPNNVISNVSPTFRWADSTINARSRLTIEVPSPGGAEALYSRLANFEFDLSSSSNPNPQDQISLHCAFGFATDANDLPAASASYTNIDVNVEIVEEDPANPNNRITTGGMDGSGSIAWNPQSGEVTFNLFYEINDQGGTVSFGPLTGTLTTNTATGRIGFQGSLTATPAPGIGNTSDYQVVGGFFGPSGAEVGFVISAVADDDNDTFNEELIIVRGVAR